MCNHEANGQAPDASGTSPSSVNEVESTCMAASFEGGGAGFRAYPLPMAGFRAPGFRTLSEGSVSILSTPRDAS